MVGTDKDQIVQELSKLITDADSYNSMAKAINPYGDGKACPRILTAFENL